MKNVDVYESKDKQIVPFLLTQKEISFIGTRVIYSTIYFQFIPFKKCTELVNLFTNKKAPLIQPKDLLDSVEAFKNRIFEMKGNK